LNGTYEQLAYADEVNLLGDDTDTTEKNHPISQKPIFHSYFNIVYKLNIMNIETV
jgi:hypothetical protein